VIDFRLEANSGLATYLQLVHQVRQAVRLGHLRQGDQVPTVREVVAKLAINPNTVLKAYRELEREGVVVSRPGIGTFVREGVQLGPRVGQAHIRAGLARLVQKAREAGFDDADLGALFDDVVRRAEEPPESIAR
jgi:GntR family transcriptional regulator